MNGTAKARRQQAILELVRARAVASQDQLARGLRRRGHAVAQSTLSRDLKELRVFRVPGAEGYRYRPAGRPTGRAHDTARAGRHRRRRGGRCRRQRGGGDRPHPGGPGTGGRRLSSTGCGSARRWRRSPATTPSWSCPPAPARRRRSRSACRRCSASADGAGPAGVSPNSGDGGRAPMGPFTMGPGSARQGLEIAPDRLELTLPVEAGLGQHRLPLAAAQIVTVPVRM